MDEVVQVEWTDLMEACVRNNMTTVISLLTEETIDVNAIEYDYRTALSLACENGNYAMVRILLEKGADPNGAMDWWSPLLEACYKGYISIVHLLLSWGANFSGRETYYAVQGGHVDVLDFLLRYNDDAGGLDFTENDSPVHIAAWYGCTAMVAYLIEIGCEVDEYGSDGTTPIEIANLLDHTMIVILLMYSGAFLEEDDDDNDPQKYDEIPFRSSCCASLSPFRIQ
jgi:ankyrin repeat protein